VNFRYYLSNLINTFFKYIWNICLLKRFLIFCSNKEICIIFWKNLSITDCYPFYISVDSKNGKEHI